MNLDDYKRLMARIAQDSDVLSPTFTPNNPIYSESFEYRLADLKSAVEQAQTMLAHPDLLRPCTDNAEGLQPGEFALDNWIVRPRFK